MAILALLFLVCLLNVKITVGNKDSFYWKLHVGGIRIKPEWFMGKKDNHNKDEKDSKVASKKDKKTNKKKSDTQETESEAAPKKKNPGQVIALITRIATTACRAFPKGIRIKLKYLNITAGGKEAEQAAVMYGRIHWILASLFALFDSYRGFLYGFRAKRHKVVINVDYLSGKTSAEFELVLSFFVWQMLFVGIRVGTAAILQLIKNAAEDDTDTEEALDEASKELSAS